MVEQSHRIHQKFEIKIHSNNNKSETLGRKCDDIEIIWSGVLEVYI